LNFGSALAIAIGLFIKQLTRKQNLLVPSCYPLANYLGISARKKNATILLISGE